MMSWGLAFIPLLFLASSCDSGRAFGGKAFCSQKAATARYSPEAAFRILQEKYGCDRARYICLFVDDEYFFPIEQKTFSWRKIGYWVNPYTGECGKSTDTMKYLEDGTYQAIAFERQRDGYTYKSVPATIHLGTWLQMRKRFLGF